MSRLTTKFYATPDEAIKSAKSRAKSKHGTQYVYQSDSGFCVRSAEVSAWEPVMKVLFDGTVNHLKPINEALNEQEIKDIVEQIVKLESQADDLTEQDNFSQSSAATEAAGMLEDELNQQGYFLGESGSDMIVYRKGFPEVAKEEWMRFDCLEWKWREPNAV